MRAVPGRVNRYYLPLRGQFCQLARSLFSSRSGPESPRRGGSSGTFTALLVAAFHACMPDCLKLDNQRHRKYVKLQALPHSSSLAWLFLPFSSKPIFPICEHRHLHKKNQAYAIRQTVTHLPDWAKPRSPCSQPDSQQPSGQLTPAVGVKCDRDAPRVRFNSTLFRGGRPN